jgi:phosphatidylserine/phosphatidylglycerophosphate/cardiolipin synthase-like enzyme
MTRSKERKRWMLLLLPAGLLLVAGLSLWRRGEAQSPLLEPLPQDPLIQAYFNQSQAARYREPYRGVERLGDDLEQVIVEGILSARRSLDIAIQELRLPRIAEALVQRHRAGVRVRVIVENNYRRPLSQVSGAETGRMTERDRTRYQEALRLMDENGDGRVSPPEASRRDALVMLEQARVPLIDDTADGSKGSGLMHHKFVVVDGQVVIVGSANFTTSDIHGDFGSPESRGNPNHLLRIQNLALAQIFTEEFNLMWGDGPGGRPDSRFGLQKTARSPRSALLAPTSRVTVQFSPTSPSQPWQISVNGLIGRALSASQRQVNLALFVFSDQNLGSALETQHQKGVQVRALIDPGFAFRYYSEALDMMGVVLPDTKCRIERGNKTWGRAIATVGVPTLPEGDLLHHKFAVIDQQRVITGSQNWSAAANHNNDENLLVIDNATVAAHFQREFERLYATAELGIPGWLQQKAQQEQTRCGLVPAGSESRAVEEPEFAE